MTRVAAFGQLIRYGLVGLASNAALYVAYLLLAALGLDPRVAMTITYCAGVALTFGFNRMWSFRHDGPMHEAFIRYLSCYAFGYFFNLVVLWIAVEQFGWPHQIVQGIMIFVLAILLFLFQKFWVFSDVRQVGPQSPI